MDTTTSPETKFSHLGAQIQNDNNHLTMTDKKIHDMIKVRVKVEISSMSRNDKKIQAVKCYDEMNKNFILNKVSEKLDKETSPKLVFILYEPYNKLKPQAFIDTNVIAGNLLVNDEHECYFLAYDSENLPVVSIPRLQDPTKYSAGQALIIEKKLDSEESKKLLENLKPDAIIPPTWIMNEKNVRLGGDRGNWTKLVNYYRNNKNHTTSCICLVFDVQNMQDDFPDIDKKLLTADYVFTGAEVYYPATEENKHTHEAWNQQSPEEIMRELQNTQIQYADNPRHDPRMYPQN